MVHIPFKEAHIPPTILKNQKEKETLLLIESENDFKLENGFN